MFDLSVFLSVRVCMSVECRIRTCTKYTEITLLCFVCVFLRLYFQNVTSVKHNGDYASFIYFSLYHDLDLDIYRSQNTADLSDSEKRKVSVLLLVKVLNVC